MILTLLSARRQPFEPDPEHRRDTFELLFGRRFEEVGKPPAVGSSLRKDPAEVSLRGFQIGVPRPKKDGPT